MPIKKYLDLSTAHMTEADNELLACKVSDGSLIVTEHSYGYWVHVPQNPSSPGVEVSTFKDQGFSEDFCKAMAYAYQNDCWWINFDRDAPIEEELNTHEW
jgi:hypothetical protein